MQKHPEKIQSRIKIKLKKGRKASKNLSKYERKGMSSFQPSDERKKSNLFGCQLIWLGFIFLAVNEPLFYILKT